MLLSFFSSSIGKKLLVAITGMVLVGFVLGHMIGNLLIFMPDHGHAINEYGHMLQTMGHGVLVWVARVVIFGSIGLHVVLTIQLTKANRAARELAYGKQHTQVASISSRTMIMSGLTILAFFIYHILHFTVRAFHGFGTAKYEIEIDGHKAHNVYQMVIDGFSWWPASLFYIIAMVLLASHLSHGVSSMFQTLGLSTEKTRLLFNTLGKAYAALIVIGNCAIPIAIYIFGYGK